MTDFRENFYKHVNANVKFQELCQKAVKLREAKKNKEADRVEKEAKKYAQTMLDIETKWKK